MKRSALRRQDAVANMREALARRAGRGTGLSSGIGFALGRSKNARILARARSWFDGLTTNGAWEFTTNGILVGFTTNWFEQRSPDEAQRNPGKRDSDPLEK
jgi:hypothetical protein